LSNKYFLESGIYDITVTVDPDVFMELILTCVHNETLNFQNYIKKQTGRAKSEIALRLRDPKKNYNKNFFQIFTLEKQLVNINDSEIRSKIESFSKFELLNNEKMPPHFLNVFRGPKKEGSLINVCDDNGDPLPDEKKRHEHIAKYFEDV
jgi:hypothetical protein